MADELYEVRSALALGNYHQAIAEGTNAKPVSKKPDDIQQFKAECDLLVSVAQVALGQYGQVIEEHRTASHPYLVAARQWAEFNQTQSEDVCAQLVAAAGETVNVTNSPIAILAVSALVVRLDYSAAITMSAKWASGLDAKVHTRQVIEFRALTTDIYLRLNRIDLADKELKAMQTVDDDAVLTLLMSAVVALRHNKPDKSQEAVMHINDLVGRCGQTVSLLNLQALAYLNVGKTSEAERSLLDALAKRSGDHDTVANLSVTALHLGKVPDRFISQAKGGAPNAPWSKTHTNMQQRFREAAAQVTTPDN